jgi:hypothetical protein
MNEKGGSKAMLAGLLVMAGMACAQGPQWSAEQAGVWKVVQESWQKDQRKDLSWMDNQIRAGASMWDSRSSTPVSAAENRRWVDHYNKHSTMLIHQVTPLAISVDADAALVHYAWSAVYQTDDDRDHERGRCSDTLVRRNGNWEFLGWSCSMSGDD